MSTTSTTPANVIPPFTALTASWVCEQRSLKMTHCHARENSVDLVTIFSYSLVIVMVSVGMGMCCEKKMMIG